MQRLLTEEHTALRRREGPLNVLARRLGNWSSRGRWLRRAGGIAVLAVALSGCAAPTTTSLQWRGPFESAAFVRPIFVHTLVTWRGHLWAAGSDKQGSAVWESSNGKTWVWHPFTGDSTSQLLATPGKLILLTSHAGGTGDGTGPPPYEDLTAIYTSTNGVQWNKQSIPVAMEQGGIGNAVWGHGRVIVPTYNFYDRQHGVWTETGTGGPWTFHAAFGTGAEVFVFSLATTASGFIAGGPYQPSPTAVQEAAVWTSSNGVHWTGHVLSKSTGDVLAVGSVDSRLVAVGTLGKSPHHGTVWTSTGSRWVKTKVADRFPATVDQLVDTGVGLVAVPDTEVSPMYSSADGTEWSVLKRPARLQRTSMIIETAAAWKGGIAAIIRRSRFDTGIRFCVATLSG